MVYNQKFITVVKVNGKVLREHGDIVSLPFGSEYSLLLKNLESRRASVKVSIDGKEVLDNHSLVIKPNSEVELKGFMENGAIRNAFKFIQKTQQIATHRGDFIDDGFIRVEFSYEKRIEVPKVIKRTIIHDDYHVYHNRPFFGSYSSRNQCRGVSNLSSNSSICGQSTTSNNIPSQDEGITVKGSNVKQDFIYTHLGELDHPETIIIRLKGITQSGQVVQKPLTVDTKLICPTCGDKSKSNMKFCGNCGTCLQ